MCTAINYEHAKSAKAAIMDIITATPMLHDDVYGVLREEVESKDVEPFTDFAASHGKLKASSPFTRCFEQSKTYEFYKTDTLHAN